MKSGHRHALVVALLLVSAAPAAWAQAAPQSEQQQKAALEAKFKAIDASLHPQSGTVPVPGASATLNLGKAYYFLPADEAKRVLTEGWGNPPDQVADVLGMVFPAGKTFHEPTWGAVIQYSDTGHVSDKDAASQDYDSVLSGMKSSEEEDNKKAAEQGYPGTHLIGWAQAPIYDSAANTLIWARNIKFDGEQENTLNYDVRTLGRAEPQHGRRDVEPSGGPRSGEGPRRNGEVQSRLALCRLQFLDRQARGLWVGGPGRRGRRCRGGEEGGAARHPPHLLQEGDRLHHRWRRGAARLVQAEVRRRLQGRAFDEQPAEQLPPAE
jgi:hypothetical protein